MEIGTTDASRGDPNPDAVARGCRLLRNPSRALAKPDGPHRNAPVLLFGVIATRPPVPDIPSHAGAHDDRPAIAPERYDDGIGLGGVPSRSSVQARTDPGDRDGR